MQHKGLISSSISKIIKEYVLIIAGSILFSFAISGFLIPFKIGVGGVTGIAMSLNKLLGLRVGLISILINIPLFLFGFKLLGRKFAIRSGFVVIFTSVLIDYLNASFNLRIFDDVLLAAIFCGVIFGVGVALIFMGGGSTGGLDILAKILSYKFPTLRLSNLLLAQDFLVYLMVAYVFGIPAILYALVMSFIRTKALDAIQEGISSSKQCLIICDNGEAIMEEIKTSIQRGVTKIEAEGGFSKTRKIILYVVIQKNELNKLKNAVKEIEPEAFVAVSDVNDILGKFRQSISM